MQTRVLTALALLLFLAEAGAEESERERECRKVKEGIERIHAQRRMGYSAKTGRRLKARLRELELRRRKVCR